MFGNVALFARSENQEGAFISTPEDGPLFSHTAIIRRSLIFICLVGWFLNVLVNY